MVSKIQSLQIMLRFDYFEYGIWKLGTWDSGVKSATKLTHQKQSLNYIANKSAQSIQTVSL